MKEKEEKPLVILWLVNITNRNVTQMLSEDHHHILYQRPSLYFNCVIFVLLGLVHLIIHIH